MNELKINYTLHTDGAIRNAEGKLAALYIGKMLHIDGVVAPIFARDAEQAFEILEAHNKK